jgi:outer membrane protein
MHMTPSYKTSGALLACCLGLWMHPTDSRAEAGWWAGKLNARIGVNAALPQVESGNLSAPSPPGSKVDISDAYALGGGVNWTLDPHWSLDLPLGIPFKARISGDGAIAGVGEIGETYVVPVTGFVQYRFLEEKATVRPLLGLGLTYVNFVKEKGNGTLTGLLNPGGAPVTLKVQDKFTLTAQAGATYNFNERMFVEGMVAFTPLKTRTTLSTGQTIDVRLNPITAGVYVGYRY